MLTAVLCCALAWATEVEGHVDLQAHPAIQIPWPMFAPGLTDDIPRRQTWRHQFRQSMQEPHVRASGVRLILVAALAAETARNRGHAWDLVLAQFEYVEQFVAEHDEHYAMATTAAEARRLLADTDKIVLVHSIEGGHLVLEGPADARFWARRGVALITLVHLRDDELGGAGINRGIFGPLTNPRGAVKRLLHRDRGLTQRGRDAIVELDTAGIVVDLSHMSRASVDDALEVTGAHDIAPIVTHGKLMRLRDADRAITDEHLRTIYAQGGFFALGLNGAALSPVRPSVPVPERCPGTLDDFAVHAQAVLDTVGDTVEEPVVGWSSDWNGWTSHSRPTKRCRPGELPLDEVGLAHAGMLPDYWQRLEERGLDLAPLERSAEAFLRMWEQAGR